MLRSMYSGISGMKNFQTKLDVIGNNISNVNTYGFKKGRAIFKDMVSQQITAANAPIAGERGGVNPKQVGLGVQLAAIDTVHTAGSTQTTGRTLDLAISGDGFLPVNDGDNTFYTRSGNFYIDSNGDLINSDGLYLGEAGTAFNIPAEATDLSILPDGTISYSEGGVPNTDQQINIVKFTNPEGLTKRGGNLFEESANSGEPEAGVPGLDGRGAIASGSLEMSNVDLSEEFTEMIVAQRGFQANTRIITTSDEILQELMSLKR